MLGLGGRAKQQMLLRTLRRIKKSGDLAVREATDWTACHVLASSTQVWLLDLSNWLFTWDVIDLVLLGALSSSIFPCCIFSYL